MVLTAAYWTNALAAPYIRGILTYFPMKPRLHRYSDYLIPIVLGALCYLLFFHHLGGMGLVGPDEPRYAAVAREMYLSGDYVTPRLYGAPWFEKPVLLYWLVSLSYALFGIGELGARFPSAVAATLTVFLIYWCGRWLSSRETGFLAALILATSVGFFAFGRAASMDMILTACLTVALVFFLRGRRESGSARRWWFYASYGFLGLGALAKGPVAFILPVLAILAFLGWRRQWSNWRSWHPEGILVGVALAVPWYLACAWVNGYDFIQTFLINHNLERFTSTVHGHNRPVYFYIPVLVLMTFPWTFLLIPALKRRFGDSGRFIALWALVPFVFFSLAGSKLPGYILPIVPPIALLLARALVEPPGRMFEAAVYLEAGLVVFIGVAFGFFGPMINLDPHVSGPLIIAVTAIVAIGLVAVALWFTAPVLVGLNVVTMAVVVAVITISVFPRVDRLDTMRPWQEALDELVPTDRTVFLYKPRRWMEYGLQFYRHNGVRKIGSHEELIELAPTRSRNLCIIEERMLNELSRILEIDIEVAHILGNQAAFWFWRID